ncbi:MAG: hypothetical protein OXT67_12700, partial [Zetaproteobacteria bacterium]|nr:hypothetical protein [Zetaproteobacteria bacterium]
FGEGIAGVNMNQFFSGLFGFLVPSNWMKIVNQRREFQVSKYLLLKTYLDEILNAKLMYLRQHQNITEFEILNFYFIHLQLFSRTYSTNNRALATLHGRFAFEGTNMATQRGKTKLGFDDLAQVMALQQIEGDASVKHFNIQDLKDFPAQVKDLEDLEDLYKNQDAFISEVVRNSVELKAAHELLKIAQLNVGITAVGSIFSNVDRPQNANNDAQFALRFGYDTLPNILISRSLGKTAKIDVRKEYLDMLDSARRSFDLYTNSLGGYTEAKRALRVNRDAVRQNLDYLLRSKQDPDPSLILALSQLIESELKLNNALHGSLMARAYMDRFLLADYATVMKYLPDRQLLQDTLKVFADSHLEEVHKDAELDHFLYNVRHVEELKKLFQQPDHPYHEDELVSDHLIEAVKRNMDPLLYSKLSFFKNRAFYAFLDQFVQKNGIELTAHQQHLLDKKRKSLWSRWVHRRPSPHSKPEDLKL